MNRFHDPIAPKKKETQKKPWSFEAPSYDNRSSCAINAGDDYGSGFRTPVGKEGKEEEYSKGPIPLKTRRFDPREIASEDEEG